MTAYEEYRQLEALQPRGPVTLLAEPDEVHVIEERSTCFGDAPCWVTVEQSEFGVAMAEGMWSWL